uniref:hypothetical protein n=1 Tax=Gelidibacter sp. TaxID=2018083 RepID=UPI00404921D6
MSKTIEIKKVHIRNLILSFIIGLVLISCLKEPKKEMINEEYNEPITAPELNSDYNEDYDFLKEYNKSIKFAYTIFRISKPVLRGHKSEFYGDSNYCYVEFEDEVIYSEILDVENYNEDTKYKLLDDVESEILNQNKYISSSLYSNAVVNYGYDVAKDLIDNKYKIKIIDRHISTFTSYAEASKDLQKEKNQ